MKTIVISIPVNRIAAVEKALGRSLAKNQVPIVKIRVLASDVKRIREIIYGE